MKHSTPTDSESSSVTADLVKPYWQSITLSERRSLAAGSGLDLLTSLPLTVRQRLLPGITSNITLDLFLDSLRMSLSYELTSLTAPKSVSTVLTTLMHYAASISTE